MDKVGDLLIRIKNGYMASKKEVINPYSKLSMAICQLIKDEGFIKNYKVEDGKISISLKYSDKQPALTNVKRISKPGLRVYKGSKLLPYVYNGLGIAIISTPKGIMSDKKARKGKLGGEVMAYIW